MSMDLPRYEEIEHTADVALRVRGRTFPDLLAAAAEGMFSLVGAARFEESETTLRSVPISGGSAEERLHAWLRACLRAFNVEGFFPVEIRIESEAAGLVGRLRGGRFDASRHEFRSEVKGVTLHGLAVRETPDGFEAEIVFDV